MAMCAYLRHRPRDCVVVYPYVHHHDIAINTGIIGGNDVLFLKKYAAMAVETMIYDANKSGFDSLPSPPPLARLWPLMPAPPRGS
jgi:hypothetical protein